MKRTLIIDKTVTRGPARRKDGEVVGPGELRAVRERHSVVFEYEPADALAIAREAAGLWLSLQEATREAVTDYYLAAVGGLSPAEAEVDEAFQATLGTEREKLVAASMSVLNDRLGALAHKWRIPRVALTKTGGVKVTVPIGSDGRERDFVFSAAELGL